MFSKEERSSFAYWFAHWCSYNMTALNLKCWKFKYLFHDIEKPWLMLLWKDYKRVQKWHREHNRHHLEYKGFDWEAMVIDWECSRFTKEASPRTACQETFRLIDKYPEKKGLLLINVIPVLEKLGLMEYPKGGFND